MLDIFRKEVDGGVLLGGHGQGRGTSQKNVQGVSRGEPRSIFYLRREDSSAKRFGLNHKGHRVRSSRVGQGTKREFKIGDKIRVNLYRGQIDHAIFLWREEGARMHAVSADRKMQKLVRLLSIGRGFEVFVAVKVRGDDYVRTPTANSFYVKSTSPVLDL